MATPSSAPSPPSSSPPSSSPPSSSPSAFRWIKTDCGRAQYQELAQRPGLPARLRLGWFVLIAALRDWRLPDPTPTPAAQSSPPAGGS